MGECLNVEKIAGGQASTWASLDVVEFGLGRVWT